MDLQPFVKLEHRRPVEIPWLPHDLRVFYESHEGVGLEASSEYPVRLCKLDELAKISWEDLHVIGGSDPGELDELGWESFSAIRVGVGMFFDELVYILRAPPAPPGSIMAFEVDLSGPGGEGDSALECSLVLSRDFDSWIARLQADSWQEYGIAPGGIDELSLPRRRALWDHFRSLNPKIKWAK